MTADNPISYRKLDTDRRSAMELKIATIISAQDLCSNTSRKILYEVLREFRPDLFADFDIMNDPARLMRWAFENLLVVYRRAASGCIHEMSDSVNTDLTELDEICARKKSEFMKAYREHRDR